MYTDTPPAGDHISSRLGSARPLISNFYAELIVSQFYMIRQAAV